MIKRFLDSFVHAAAWSSGGVIGARGGNDLSYWAKSRESRSAAALLGQTVTMATRDTKDAIESESESETESETENETIDEIDESIQRRARELRSSVDSLRNGHGSTGGYERISLDRRAAQYAIERKATSPRSLRVRCPHCESPVRVLRNDEVARCPACAQRFLVERATRT
jgi:DNA-directed RNA polymerase subunit RPC12/RpoP